MTTTRRRTKIPVRTLERRGRGLHEAVSEAVDALSEAERRERALSAGAEQSRAELEGTYPALKGGAR